MILNGRVTSIRGSNAGIPKLTMRVRVQNEYSSSFEVLGASAEMYAANATKMKGLTDESTYLGLAAVEITSSQLAPSGETDWDVRLPIPHHVLQQVEDTRNGGDMMLILKIQFSGCSAPQTGGPLQFTHGSLRSGHYGFCIHRIPKSDWVATLKQLGYGDYYLVEIPLRSVPKQLHLKKAVAQLEVARNHFSDGNHADTLAALHKALERLALDSGATQPDQNGWDKVLAGCTDGKKREKLKHLLHRLSDFMHLGRHEHKDVELVELGRSDAEFSIILVQATLGYLAKLAAARASSMNPRQLTGYETAIRPHGRAK